jgi:hypothetical protein
MVTEKEGGVKVVISFSDSSVVYGKKGQYKDWRLGLNEFVPYFKPKS